jgi:CRISPR-associated endonuclease Csn1
MSKPPSLRYRLGLDLGANSLGYFLVKLDERGEACGIVRGGVRIYPDGRDPQSGTSNAVDRRQARGARRRRDRYLERRTALMALLVRHGLMPKQPAERKKLESLDPYELRLRGLTQPLAPCEVGRALFHLNQRRGFASNRKTEKRDNEAGAIKQAAHKLEELLEQSGAETLGALLAGRHTHKLPVRARNVAAGPKAEYEFYPLRGMLQHEFDLLWSRQAAHHPALMTAEAHHAIRHVIFYQRPLRQPPVGKCALSPATNADDAEGFRCPRAHPLAQRFRIWQEVRNLAIAETGQPNRPLDKEQQDKVALALLQNNKLSFEKIRALLKLPAEVRFNLEGAKRTELKGDETAARLSHKDYFGKSWRGLALERQIAIVEKLLEEEDEEELIRWLVAEAGVMPQTAETIAGALLPEGHAHLGLRAIKALLPFMEAGSNYPEAARKAGFDHALLPDGALSASGYLPYYGEWLEDDVIGSGDPQDSADRRWGRFPNPTVHIGLGQLRRTVNALIREYGPPDAITLEMTRDFKLSPEKLRELEAEQAKNQRRNEDRDRQLQELGQAQNARNRLKLRLWEEQGTVDRCCPFSGENIPLAKLFSDEVEIEHLIPFSESWDDSAANKVVCYRSANRIKGKKTPYEAYGHLPEWPDILARANGLPQNKRWRFGPDARQRFGEEEGFLSRQLNETGWLARSAKQYLSAVCNPNRINVLPGKLTALIRGKWRLDALLPDHNFSDAKNRKDHRHHAIDALIAAVTDRSLLHRMASATEEERDRIMVPFPWPSLRDDLDAALKAMIVSHKPDHGVGGQLHEETAYGRIAHPEQEDGATLVYRKAFTALNEKEVSRIRDRRLRGLLLEHIKKAAGQRVDFKTALARFADGDGPDGTKAPVNGLAYPIRHVRLTKVENLAYTAPVSDPAGKVYKVYSAGKNAYVDLYEMPDSSWQGSATSMFDANRPGWRPAWREALPQARFLMRVFKGDLIRIEEGGQERILLVHRLDAAAGRFKLANHNEAGNLDQRHADPEDPFRWLMASYNTLRKLGAGKIRVDELGRPWRVRPEEAARTLGLAGPEAQS